MDDSLPSGENKLPLFVSLGAIAVAVIALLFAFKARSEAKTAGEALKELKDNVAVVQSSVDAKLAGVAKVADVDTVRNEVTQLKTETANSITQIGDAFKQQNAVIKGLVGTRTHGTAAPAPGGTSAAPVAAAGEYIVKAGDTGFKIARANGVTTKALEAANPGVSFTKLKVGQKIKLPEKKAN